MKSISIQSRKGDTFRPQRGFKGISFAISKKQYFQPQVGFKGISFERPRVGGVQLVVMYRSYGKYAINMVRTISVVPYIETTGEFAGRMLFKVKLLNGSGVAESLDEFIAVSFQFSYVQNGIGYGVFNGSVDLYPGGTGIAAAGFTGGEENIKKCTVTITGVKGTNPSRFLYSTDPATTIL